jgi:Concanavalin A-like lectin/glucanases superfamily
MYINNVKLNNDVLGGFPATYSYYFSSVPNVSAVGIQVASNNAFAFGSGDFTIEFFMYLPSHPNNNISVLDFRSGANSNINGYLYIDGGSNSLIYAINGGPGIVITGNSPIINTWVYVALSRVSNITRMYMNGVQVGSSYTDNNNYVAGPVTIGAFNEGGIDNVYGGYFGYLSNLRIIKGVGVFSGTSIPVPYCSLPLYATNTSLLTLQNTTLIDNSTNNFTLSAYYGTTTVSSTIIPF